MNVTLETIDKELQEICNNNLLKIADHTNFAYIREEFRKVIVKAERNNIDILNRFPVVVRCGDDFDIEFNYNGFVYKRNRNEVGTIVLFTSYNSDSICQGS